MEFKLTVNQIGVAAISAIDGSFGVEIIRARSIVKPTKYETVLETIYIL